MNWKVSLSLKYPLILLIITSSVFLMLVTLTLGSILYESRRSWDGSEQRRIREEPPEVFIKKDRLSSEVSPLMTKSVIAYTINNKPLFQNHIMIAIQDVDGQKEEPVFIGEERTGTPDWLDDDHIFFTSYCGTACKGVYLIDVRNKETKLATLSFTFSDINSWETHFRDWFGKEFQFPGLLGKLSTEFIVDSPYLVFSGKSQFGDYEKKRFLFTGESLIEQ